MLTSFDDALYMCKTVRHVYVGQGNSPTPGPQGDPPRGPQVSVSVRTRRGTAAAAADPAPKDGHWVGSVTQNDDETRGQTKAASGRGPKQARKSQAQNGERLTTLPSGPIYGAGAGQKAGCGPDGLGQSRPPTPR